MADSIFRQYYGKKLRQGHETRQRHKGRDEEGLSKEYPDKDTDKFRFEVSVDQDLNVKKSIYHKLDDTDDTLSYDITSDTFLNIHRVYKIPNYQQKDRIRNMVLKGRDLEISTS